MNIHYLYLKLYFIHLTCKSFVLGSDLVSDFLQFQDQVEEAIAQAAVLPRIIAVPMFLNPVEKKRRCIVDKLETIISDICTSGEAPAGEWMREFARNAAGGPHRGNGTQSYKRTFSPREAAELCCGLLFASHKNPCMSVCSCGLILDIMVHFAV